MKQLRHTTSGVKTPAKAFLDVPAVLFSFLINCLKPLLYRPFLLTFTTYLIMVFIAKSAGKPETPVQCFYRLVTKPFLQAKNFYQKTFKQSEKQILSILITITPFQKQCYSKNLVESPSVERSFVVKCNFPYTKIPTS